MKENTEVYLQDLGREDKKIQIFAGMILFYPESEKNTS